MTTIVFHEIDPPFYPQWLNYKHNLKLMLWAGDGIHDGICDIQRLSDYDVFLCAGYSGNLDINIAYINKHYKDSKIICILDVTSKGQLASFCSLFWSRFKVINSDYFGNTPSLDLDTYSALLSTGGTAYNIRGLNGLRYPVEEFLNVLELFAPVLPNKLNLQRMWTPELLQLAEDNGLTPSSTWSSPDLLENSYKNIRERQLEFQENQARTSRGKYHPSVDYSAETLEQYWSLLSTEILTTDLQSLQRMGDFVEYKDRFAIYLRSLISEEYQQYAQSESLDEEIVLLQKCLRLTRYFEHRTIPASLRWRLGKFTDSRWPEAFDILLSKNDLYISK
jgi:hypothetical protein